MSPLELEVLLNIYYSPVWQNPKFVHEEAFIFQLKENGIIAESKRKTLEPPLTHGWALTDKGNAWVQLILNVPMPKKAWVDENGQVIKVVV